MTPDFAGEELDATARQLMADRGRRDLFFFARAILGFKDLTPDCHGPVTAMLDYDPSQFKLILMPRDHLKTSLVTIAGTMQAVMRNPEERVLIANESATNAARFLRAIRQQAESNTLLRALYPEVIPSDTKSIRWSDGELDFIRQGKYPEPTFDHVGMTGAFTSRHFTLIVPDDIVSEEAVKSALVMQDVKTRLSGFLSLLTEPERDRIWMVGTRWAMDDPYSFWMDVMGDRLSVLKRSAIENGQPIWPERFSLETLALKRQLLGDYRFSALYENEPHNSSAQVLDMKKCRGLRWTKSEDVIVLLETDGRELGRRRLGEMDITCAVDLAVSEKISADRTAITVVGTTAENEHIVLDSWAERADPSRVIERLFYIKQRFNPRVFGIEAQGYQQALIHFAKNEMQKRGIYLNIEPITTGRTSKVARVRGLEPIVSTGRLYVSHADHDLRREMSEFPLGKHDDMVDSLSMHLKLVRKPQGEAFWNRYKEQENKIVRRILGKEHEEEDFDGGPRQTPTYSWSM